MTPKNPAVMSREEFLRELERFGRDCVQAGVDRRSQRVSADVIGLHDEALRAQLAAMVSVVKLADEFYEECRRTNAVVPYEAGCRLGRALNDLAAQAPSARESAKRMGIAPKPHDGLGEIPSGPYPEEGGLDFRSQESQQAERDAEARCPHETDGRQCVHQVGHDGWHTLEPQQAEDGAEQRTRPGPVTTPGGTRVADQSAPSSSGEKREVWVCGANTRILDRPGCEACVRYVPADEAERTGRELHDALQSVAGQARRAESAERRVKALAESLGDMLDLVIWMSGADAFNADTEAGERWRANGLPRWERAMTVRDGLSPSGTGGEKCKSCKGTGWDTTGGERCSVCDGTGTRKTGGDFDQWRTGKSASAGDGR